MHDGPCPLIAPDHPGTETLRVPVIKVFDGDGFLTRITHPRRDLAFEATIRFGFTDAPEMDQPGGPEAREFLISLIGGSWVDLVILTKMDTGGIIDRHRRIVAVPYLTTAGPTAATGTWSGFLDRLPLFGRSNSITRNIELEMVLNGWAWVLERYGPDERYFEAFDDARAARRGIWAYESNVDPWEFKKQKYQARRPARMAASPQRFSSHQHRNVACPAEGCAGHLVERRGRFGRFLGCSSFPQCRYSRKLPA